MTAATANLDGALDYDPRKPLAPLIARGTRAAFWFSAAVIVLLAGIYSLLINPFWVRHGDGEVFLGIARNLVQGRGYRFNGQPVQIVPPGWPLVLAAAMTLTTKLLWLKLLPMLSMIGFLSISYVILLRYTTPIVAALCIVTVAILDPVFSLSYLFFSDGLFCFLAMLAVWLALRINDGADSWWRIGLLALLCAAAVAVRWAGTYWFALIAGALLSGERRPSLTRRFLACGIAFLATCGTFLALRYTLRVDQSALDPRYDTFLAGAYDLVNEEDTSAMIERFTSFGQWIAGLLWRPGVFYYFTRHYANVIGWIIAGCMAVMFWDTIRKRQWLFAAAAVYVCALAANWPKPMPRYIVPAAPLIMLAAYQGISLAASRLPRTLNWVRTFSLNLFFASIVLINGLLYLSQVWIMRTDDFYERFQGGVHKELIDAAWYLNHLPSGNYEVAISSRWVNLNRKSYSDGYRRALNFLTHRPIVVVPFEEQQKRRAPGQQLPDLCREPDAEVVAWLKQHNVRFYLYQPPIWLVENFALKSRQGIPIDKANTQWRLYEIIDNQAHRVMLEPTHDWPRDVPGM
jgi:hypothetical protein